MIVVAGVAVSILHQKEVDHFAHAHALAAEVVAAGIPVFQRAELREHLAVAAGLFAGLAQRGLLGGLAGLDAALGKSPTWVATAGGDLDQADFVLALGLANQYAAGGVFFDVVR